MRALTFFFNCIKRYIYSVPVLIFKCQRSDVFIKCLLTIFERNIYFPFLFNENVPTGYDAVLKFQNMDTINVTLLRYKNGVIIHATL